VAVSTTIRSQRKGVRNIDCGPCPPSGTHRYFFKVYTLDRPLNINPDPTKYDLEMAMEGF